MDWMIFICIAVGFLLGFKKLFSEKQMKWNGRLQTVWLLLLIFAMGVGIGRDADLMAKLPSLGFRALLFTVFAIAGSVAAVWILCRLFGLGDGK